MNFARPESLWLLGAFPLLLLWGMRSVRLRRRAWEKLAQRGKPPGDGTPWLLASALLTVLALAQPKWGFSPSDSLPPGHDVVLLIDVSRSMGAEDAVPDRLGVAKESARSLVEALAKAPGNRVAVVAFAGRGVLRCPLTENVGAVLNVLDRLRPGDVRPGGTDLAAGLAVALDAFDRQEHQDGRTILVFSDGEDLADRWDAAIPADRLRNERVIVHAVAIGDPEHGHHVPVAKGPLTYRGEPVLSRRVDTALESVAKRSGGTIVPLGLASADLGSLYSSKIEPVALRTRAELRIAERVDRFPLFLFAALALALVGCRTGRARGRMPGRLAWSRLRPRFVRLGRRRAVGTVTASLLMFSLAGAGDEGREQGSAVQTVSKGLMAYREGRYQEALADFESVIRSDPSLAIPRYNAAAARYQLGQFAEAYATYLEARPRAGAALRTKIDYALGNAALASGNVPQAVEHYDDCLASTEPGDALDEVRRDAAINREFALRQNKENAAEPPRQPEARKRDSKDDESGDRKDEDNRGDDPGEAEAADDAGGATPGGRRRAGGAGGAGDRDKAGRNDRDSPDRRLDEALDRIKDARKRRLPQEEPPTESGSRDDLKDW